MCTNSSENHYFIFDGKRVSWVNPNPDGDLGPVTYLEQSEYYHDLIRYYVDGIEHNVYCYYRGSERDRKIQIIEEAIKNDIKDAK